MSTDITYESITEVKMVKHQHEGAYNSKIRTIRKVMVTGSTLLYLAAVRIMS